MDYIREFSTIITYERYRDYGKVVSLLIPLYALRDLVHA
jgi:hypothetical protein